MRSDCHDHPGPCEVDSERETRRPRHRSALLLRLTGRVVRRRGPSAADSFPCSDRDRPGGCVGGLSAGSCLCGLVPNTPPATVAAGNGRGRDRGGDGGGLGAAPAIHRRAVDPALRNGRSHLVWRAGIRRRGQCDLGLWIERCDRREPAGMAAVTRRCRRATPGHHEKAKRTEAR